MFLTMMRERKDWPSSTSKHLETIRRYADMCRHSVEIGMEYGNTTIAFLASKCPIVITYDIGTGPGEADQPTIDEI